MSRILLLHLRDHLLRHEEETGHIGVHYQIVVVLGVIGERLRNENPCVVNQQVDTAEMLDRRFRHFDGGFLLADVSVDEDEIGRRFELLRLADSPRSSDHAIAVFEKCQRDSEADSTGSARHNGDRLLCAAHTIFFLIAMTNRALSARNAEVQLNDDSCRSDSPWLFLRPAAVSAEPVSMSALSGMGYFKKSSISTKTFETVVAFGNMATMSFA